MRVRRSIFAVMLRLMSGACCTARAQGTGPSSGEVTVKMSATLNEGRTGSTLIKVIAPANRGVISVPAAAVSCEFFGTSTQMTCSRK